MQLGKFVRRAFVCCCSVKTALKFLWERSGPMLDQSYRISFHITDCVIHAVDARAGHYTEDTHVLISAVEVRSCSLKLRVTDRIPARKNRGANDGANLRHV